MESDKNNNSEQSKTNQTRKPEIDSEPESLATKTN